MECQLAPLEAYVHERQHDLPAMQLSASSGSCEITTVVSSLELDSAFQAIYCARTGRPVGYEALLRASDIDGRQVPPPEVFATSRGFNEIARLERLCRAMHIAAFGKQSLSTTTDLFLNVDGNHLPDIACGDALPLSRLLSDCNLTPRRVVLEILESEIADSTEVISAIALCRKQGYRVAIDDFGRGKSNAARLFQLKPDIVKLDRSLIASAAARGYGKRVFTQVVRTCHELGASVVCEGIETSRQDDIATAVGCELLQGYFYSRPQTTLAQELIVRADSALSCASNPA